MGDKSYRLDVKKKRLEVFREKTNPQSGAKIKAIANYTWDDELRLSHVKTTGFQGR